MSADQEIIAMGKVLDAIEKLTPEERTRVLDWAIQKFNTDLKGPRPSLGRGNSNDEESYEHSTDTIATALSTKSGPDLVIAAAAHLHFSGGKPKFTRQELSAAMKTAPAYFKDSYLNNLSSYLNGLTKSDRLRLISRDTYALSNKERQNLSKVLATL